jgi:hypothetical protein
MLEALRLEGYPGSVDTVRRYLRKFQRRRHPIATAFIPQTLSSGEAYQFDWSHEHVELAGVEQVVKVAHVRLCHSRALFLRRWCLTRTLERSASLAGVPRRGIVLPHVICYQMPHKRCY